MSTRFPRVIWKQAASPPPDCRPTHGHRAQAFNRICEVAAMRPSNTRFFRPTPVTISNGISIGSAVFPWSKQHSLGLYIRYIAPHHSPPKKKSLTPIPVGVSGSHLIHGIFGLTSTPNEISIESAVFPKYTLVTNGQTDGPTE